MSFFVIVAYLLVVGFHVVLVSLNLRHLRAHGAEVPPEFADAVDAATLEKSTAYAAARTSFGLMRSLLSSAVWLAFLFLGGLPLYDGWMAGISDSFVLSGVLFFLGLAAAAAVFEVPFAWYSTFHLEARYGFNRTPPRLFWSDLAKGALLSTFLLGVLSAGGLYLVQRAPGSWWFWAWALYTAVSITVMLIAPVLIEPLFFKMKPLESSALGAEVRALAERAGVQVKRIYEVDASRRSSHSNAYFTGLGRVKRVVLFDTLLERMSPAEITAVLAHELGHWRLKHITQRLGVSLGGGLIAFFLAFQLHSWVGLPGLLGLESASFFARLLILAFVAQIVTFPLTWLTSSWSRKHEWQADGFATELTSRPADLASALVKLARDNLANLHPHPWYAAFYYSHPPAVARVRKLLEAAG